MDLDILVTVIVPAYNAAEWLPRCLDSILAQTYKNLEIIVIDDGSSDETPQIIDSYAGKNGRVIAVHQKNKGLVETREIGISLAKGEFVGFVDADDEIIPEMYEKLVGNAVKYGSQISQCGILYCFYDGRRKPVHGTGKVTKYNRLEGCAALLKGSEMEPSLCNKIYSASLLKDSCLDRTIKNNEDMLRNIVLFNRADSSIMEDFCGYLYWRREDSMSNNVHAVGIGKNIIQARKTILDYVPDELNNEAAFNYVSGVLNTYHSLIGNDSKEAAELRRDCIGILQDALQKHKELPRSARIKISMILHIPFIYDSLRKLYIIRRNNKIRKQTEKK